MQGVYNNIDEYSLRKKGKILIVFAMIANMTSNKKLNPVVTELFIKGRKLNISPVFITQSYFKVPKDVGRNSTYYFTKKTPNRRELQEIAINHSSEIDFEELKKIYKRCIIKPYSFSVKDATLPSDDLLRFRQNLLKITCTKS